MQQQEKQLLRREWSLSLKLHEAKELVGDVIHGCDPYASVVIDNHEEFKTKTVWNTKEPVWDQDCFFELKKTFSVLSVIVWDENRRVRDIPLGKVTLSKNFLNNQKGGVEQWMPLAPADTEGTVTGEIHLEISYYAPTSEVPTHNFSVHVLKATDLASRDANGLSDPYLVLHVLPDEEAESTCHTKIVHKTLNPEFNESFTFSFELTENIEEKILHISVWDWDRFTEHEFMGHMIVPFIDVLESGNKLNKAVNLVPSPVSIRMAGTVESVEGRIMSMIKPMIKRHSRKGSHNFTMSKGTSVDMANGKSFVKQYQQLPDDHSTRIDKPRGLIRLFFPTYRRKNLTSRLLCTPINGCGKGKVLTGIIVGKMVCES